MHRGYAAVAFAAVLAAALTGCTRKEPAAATAPPPAEGGTAYTATGQPYTPSRAAYGAGAPYASASDAQLEQKARGILQRTGGDVKKMTDKERETFVEAARKGLL
ncbi:MAG: hypothetical protein IT208_03940 [Chthonomonadales bacterium]|nr:hypothetical protein [Chthonomonadales bacterium]